MSVCALVPRGPPEGRGGLRRAPDLAGLRRRGGDARAALGPRGAAPGPGQHTIPNLGARSLSEGSRESTLFCPRHELREKKS